MKIKYLRFLTFFSLVFFQSQSFALSNLERKILVLTTFKAHTEHCFNREAKEVFENGRFLYDALLITRDIEIKNIILDTVKRAFLTITVEFTREDESESEFIDLEISFDFVIKNQKVEVRRKEAGNALVQVDGYRVKLYTNNNSYLSYLNEDNEKITISHSVFKSCISNKVGRITKDYVEGMVAKLNQVPGKGLRGLNTSSRPDKEESTESNLFKFLFNIIGQP